MSAPQDPNWTRGRSRTECAIWTALFFGCIIIGLVMMFGTAFSGH